MVAIGITDRDFKDFAEVLITFKDYRGILAFFVGLISHLSVGMFFGVIFTYIIQLTSSKYYLLKGIGYGVIIWALLMGFGTIFELPKFKDIHPGAALSTLVGSLIYGLLTAYVLRILDNKTKLL